MGLRGRQPKPAGQAVTRHARVGWVEVEAVPNREGPRLPPRRRNGEPWPPWVRDRWQAWRAMPHARLWEPSDWQFALDTIELVARAADANTPVSLLTELRLRERVMGTTVDARLGLRLRYVPPRSDAAGLAVSRLDDYRNL